MMNADFETKLKAVIERMHPDTRKQVEQGIEVVRWRGVNSSDDLIALVNDNLTDPNIRVTACWLLSRLNYEESVKSLLNILGNENPILRRASAQALGEINVPREQVIEPLIERLRDQDMEVRKAAAYALGQIKDKRATNALINKLKDEHEISEVRGMAAEALSKLNDRDAVVPLLTALRDPSAEVRFWSAFALGQLGIIEALPELKRLVAEDHAEISGWHSVSQEAANAIEEINRFANDTSD